MNAHPSQATCGIRRSDGTVVGAVYCPERPTRTSGTATSVEPKSR